MVPQVVVVGALVAVLLPLGSGNDSVGTGKG
jgi:hypothetical protein